MITWIDIVDTYRNKRFIMFTIIFPLFWYIMMVNVRDVSVTFDLKQSYLWLVIACIIGISGNSVVTFAKKISGTYRFYQLQAKTSHYSLSRWLISQLLVQLILNLSICLTVLLSGIIMHTIALNGKTLFIVLLLLLMGVYLSIIGFLIGVLVDGKTIAALSMPLSMIFGVLMIRWNTILPIQGILMTSVSVIQKIFPGYYLFDIINKLVKHESVLVAMVQFFSSCLLILVPIVLLMVLKRNKIKQVVIVGKIS